MTKIASKQLLLTFLFIFSAIPLWGNTELSSSPSQSQESIGEQTNTPENSKTTTLSPHAPSRYKKYLPYGFTALKSIPHLYSSILTAFLLTRTNAEIEDHIKKDKPLLQMERIGLLISCIAGMENIYKDVVHHNHTIQKDTNNK